MEAGGRRQTYAGCYEPAAAILGVMNLLQPLKKQLKFESDIEPDDVLMTLWAIYLQALRLAFNNSLLAASVVKTEENRVSAIIQYIKPKFALILKSR